MPAYDAANPCWNESAALSCFSSTSPVPQTDPNGLAPIWRLTGSRKAAKEKTRREKARARAKKTKGRAKGKGAKQRTPRVTRKTRVEKIRREEKGRLQLRCVGLVGGQAITQRTAGERDKLRAYQHSRFQPPPPSLQCLHHRRQRCPFVKDDSVTCFATSFLRLEAEF